MAIKAAEVLPGKGGFALQVVLEGAVDKPAPPDAVEDLCGCE